MLPGTRDATSGTSDARLLTKIITGQYIAALRFSKAVFLSMFVFLNLSLINFCFVLLFTIKIQLKFIHTTVIFDKRAWQYG